MRARFFDLETINHFVDWKFRSSLRTNGYGVDLFVRIAFSSVTSGLQHLTSHHAMSCWPVLLYRSALKSKHWTVRAADPGVHHTYTAVDLVTGAPTFEHLAVWMDF